MNSLKPPEPRAALIRLLIVIVITIGFIIYAYGWTVTDINLTRPQEEQRQTNVELALRELLSPNIFQQDREIVEIVANFRVGCEADETVEQPAESQVDGAAVTIAPDCGDPGDVVQVTITGMESLAEGRIRWRPPGEDGQTRPRDILEIEREDFIFGDTGSFTGSIEVPQIRGAEGEISQIVVRAAVPSGPVRLSDTTEQVIDRMAETIFMALVATSVAIPIAALISFFAARNLMAPIHLSTGGLLIAFIAFAAGLGLGAWILKGVADAGVDIGRAEDNIALISFIVPVLVVAGLLLLSRFSTITTLKAADNQPRWMASVDSALRSIRAVVDRGVETVVNALTGFVVGLVGEDQVSRDAVRDWLIRGLGWLWRMVVRIAYVVGAVFIVGIIGGLGLLGGEQINILADKIRPGETANLWGDLRKIAGDAVSGVGNLLAVLGELVELFTVLVGALIGGFALSGIAVDLLASPLRRVPKPVGHVLGAILGAISGGLLLALTGQFGTWAALLGLLSPIVAAILGGQIAVGLYKLALQRQARAHYEVDRIDDIAQWVAFVVGAIVTFYFTLTYLDIQRILVLGTLPPTRTIEYLGIELSAYVRDNVLVGAVLGGVAGLISGTRAPFPAGSILYNVSRTILNTVRSIEPLIMGLVFVIWVGIGPFAGVLALTLHSIAALGKLYSEQVENIDEGPVEALESTGANRLQTIIYAVVPQIIPPYIAFTMYRWDINVRMSTIIGFVGGGGIGLLLQQQINLLQYREAGVAVLAIAVVVSILDYASATIRARLT